MGNVARPHIDLVTFYDFQIILSLKKWLSMWILTGSFVCCGLSKCLCRALVTRFCLKAGIQAFLNDRRIHWSLIQYLSHRLDHIIISIEFQKTIADYTVSVKCPCFSYQNLSWPHYGQMHSVFMGIYYHFANLFCGACAPPCSYALTGIS